MFEISDRGGSGYENTNGISPTSCCWTSTTLSHIHPCLFPCTQFLERIFAHLILQFHLIYIEIGHILNFQKILNKLMLQKITLHSLALLFVLPLTKIDHFLSWKHAVRSIQRVSWCLKMLKFCVKDRLNLSFDRMMSWQKVVNFRYGEQNKNNSPV